MSGARYRWRLIGFALVILSTLSACAPDRGAGMSSRPADRTAPASTANATRSSAPVATGADAASNMVWMGDHFFSPSRITVRLGATITWRMLGSQEHDVWSLDGSFHSPTMGPGSVFTHTFTKAGTFKYICLPHHGDGMFGEIVVEP